MLEITPYSTTTSIAAQGYRASEGPKHAHTAAEPAAGDQVELSAAALDSSAQTEVTASAERVREVRAQIDAGTYLTDEKLDAVVDRLHQELFGTQPAQQA